MAEATLAALTRRGVAFEPFDLTQAAFSNVEALRAPLYFNQASPSAYLRGNTRAVPLALAYMRSLELLGARVLNGADVFALELSERARKLRCSGRSVSIAHVRSRSTTPACATCLRTGYPLAGAPRAGPGRQRRAYSRGRLARRRRRDLHARSRHLAARQSFRAAGGTLPHDPERGIIRLELLGGELLYAMRVVTHGRFNLCPSPVCNPDDGAGSCELPNEPAAMAAPPVEFYPFPEVPEDAVATAKRIGRAAKLDVGGIEYLETVDGRRVFYDINANSNLRPSVAEAFGFDPFERVVDFLAGRLASRSRPATGQPSRSGDALPDDLVPVLAQNLAGAIVGQRAIEEVALAELAGEVFEQGRLLGGLDAFGRDIHRQA